MSIVEAVEALIDTAFGNQDVAEGFVVYAGVDPGMTGAAAFIMRQGGDEKSWTADVPTVTVRRKGGTKTEYDLRSIQCGLAPLYHYKSYVRFAVEESQVQVKGKGANAYTGFRVGVGFGCWLGIIAGLGFSYERVHPAVWKRSMGLLGKDKDASRLKAMELFPNADVGRKKDHGRAEALLLAEWLKRKHSGGG
jgi:hypothetical protein